jgi:hypothetical protein
MALDYVKLRAKARSLITDTFGGMNCTVNHLDGSSSSGVIIFSSTDLTDESIAEVGTVNNTVRVAYIDDVTNEVCVGDSVTANSVTYRIRDVRKYEPAFVNVAYRVTLDV